MREATSNRKSAYLNASHVADGELNLTIGNVEKETMPRGDKEEKIVIYFQEYDARIAAQQNERRHCDRGFRRQHR